MASIVAFAQQSIFGVLGLDPARMTGQLEQLASQGSLGLLELLGQQASFASGGLGLDQFARGGSAFVAPQGFVPAPSVAACSAEGTYAASGAFQRAWSHVTGGAAHGQLMTMFDGMFRAAASGGVMPGSGSAFPEMMLAGTAQAAQGGRGAAGGDDVSATLADPSLTVEDKVCLMIMQIMKKMDKEIEAQSQNINKLQQQQQQGGGGGGKGGGGGGGGGDKSIDVETMKLKRLIDKRSQMFDMLRQIIDKYNQTAKGIIDTIGR